MNVVVDTLDKKYDELLTVLAIVLETRETNGGEKPEDVDLSLESFQKSLLSFQASCDEAQEFVETLKHSVGCEKFPEHVFDTDSIPIKIDDEKMSKIKI
ncbi:hypothetical protein R3W88_025414 [Solanum pinnatisectum]|uniref:Uncharacterized protein n=1 Tax=Solanum pinnatisectum TaxID=50273 RepID=A0AAV9M3B1_9SOLN|nr:hypothetical protein R3W88_025414 [Solanum pinnatisectum]